MSRILGLTPPGFGEPRPVSKGVGVLSPEARAESDAGVLAARRARAVRAIEACEFENCAKIVRVTMEPAALSIVRDSLREERGHRIASGESIAHVNVALDAVGALWAVLP